MKTIKCPCGAEITLIPDLIAMKKAIRRHLAEKHPVPTRHGNYRIKYLRENLKIEQDLITQTLHSAAKDGIFLA